MKCDSDGDKNSRNWWLECSGFMYWTTLIASHVLFRCVANIVRFRSNQKLSALNLNCKHLYKLRWGETLHFCLQNSTCSVIGVELNLLILASQKETLVTCPEEDIFRWTGNWLNRFVEGAISIRDWQAWRPFVCSCFLVDQCGRKSRLLFRNSSVAKTIW